jgi:hypothetical protein
MPAAVPAVVGAIASGPISGIVSSVVSSVAGSALNSVMGAGGSGGLGQIIGSFTNAFGGLLGQTAGRHMTDCSPFPQPFSPFGMQPQTFNDPLSVLRNAAGDVQNFGQGIGDILNKLFGQSASTGIGRSPGSVTGGFVPGGSQGGPGGINIGSTGNQIDSLMNQANQLAQSDNLGDQLKAQQLMQKAQLMFNLASTFMQIQASMQNKAIAAMRVQ